jgi:hypothetical protein
VKNCDNAPGSQQNNGSRLSIGDMVLPGAVALAALAGVLLFLVGLPFFCISTFTDTGAFLARATAHARGTVRFISRSVQEYSGPTGSTVVTKCAENVTFQPRTGRPVTLFYEYSPDLLQDCDQNQDRLTVLYDPHDPTAARVARAIYDARTDAIIGSIVWIVVVPGALVWLMVTSRRRKQRIR